MSWWKFWKKKETPKAVPTVQYKEPIGPTRPPVQGPVPQGASVETFRRTGRTVYGSGSGIPSSPGTPPPTPTPTPTPEKEIKETKKEITRTLASQLSVSKAPDYYTSRYEQGYLESGKQAFKNVFRFETIGKRGFQPYLTGIFSPFQYARGPAKVGPYTERQLEYLKRYDVGTPLVPVETVRAWEPGISEPELRGKVRTTIGRPYEERYEQEFSKLQTQIYAGTISMEKAQEQLEKKRTLIEKEYTKKLGKGLAPITTTGKELQKAGPGLVKMGGIVGLSATGPVGATVISGAFMSGLYKGYGKGILGKDVKWYERGKELGVGTLYGGIGLVGFTGALGQIRKEILAEEVKQLTSKDFPRVSFGYREKLGKGMMKDVTFSYKKYGDARLFEKTGVISKRIRGDYYGIMGGGKSYIMTTEMGTGKQILLGAGGRVRALGRVIPTAKGWTPSVIYGKTGLDWKLFVKEGRKMKYSVDIYMGGRPTEEFLVGGIAKKSGKYVFTGAGPIKKILIFPKRYGYQFKLEDIGVLRVTEPTKTIGRTISGKPISPATKTVSSVAKITSQKLSTSLKFAPAKTTGFPKGAGITSGLKLRERGRTLLAGREMLGLRRFQQPKTKTLLAGRIRTLTRQTPALMQKQMLRERLTTKQLQKQSLQPPPAFRPKTTFTTGLGLPPSVPVGFPFFFPRIRGGLLGGRRQLFRKVKQPQAYMPSLTGAVLRVKGRARPIFGKFRLGYLPSPRGIRKKRKKRKKR
jgi:hypothetical protein